MVTILFRSQWVNTSMPKQNCRHFAGDIFNSTNCIRTFEFRPWLKFVPKVPIDNKYLSRKIVSSWSSLKSLNTSFIHNIMIHVYYDIETPSTLLPLWKGNPLVIGIFLSLMACNAELWYCLWCQPQQAVDQIIGLPMIWDANALMWWCRGNDSFFRLKRCLNEQFHNHRHVFCN